MNLPDILRLIFTPGSFEPHKEHFYNNPELMWFIVIGNAFVALAYFLIPIALWYFVRKRKDIVFHYIFVLFAAFIFFCALTHVMHIITFWYPVYWLQGIIDGGTGVISMATALALFPAIPIAVKLPSPKQLEVANRKLTEEIQNRRAAEAKVRKLNKELERRVKERTQELEEAYKQLQETEKRKDDFISMASHELKTPITSMNGYVYALTKKLSTEDKQTERFIVKIQEQIQKQTRLVADLLDVTRLQGHKLQSIRAPFDLNHLVKEAVDDMQATTDKHKITVYGKVTKEVLGDSERIGQVLYNFLSNAIKFSPNTDKIRITISEKNDEAVVAVQDFGMGMDAKHINKIFDRFYRVYDDNEKTFPGLGVGLYIAAEIIKQNDGHIWVESTKGQGSTFYFSLPFVRK